MTTAQISTHPAAVRRANFPDVMDFYAPGLKHWQTSEWVPQSPRRFLPVSVTGSRCALSCDHCQAKVLENMISLRASQDLFALASELHIERERGDHLVERLLRAVRLLRELRHFFAERFETGFLLVELLGVAL